MINVRRDAPLKDMCKLWISGADPYFLEKGWYDWNKKRYQTGNIRGLDTLSLPGQCLNLRHCPGKLWVSNTDILVILSFGKGTCGAGARSLTFSRSATELINSFPLFLQYLFCFHLYIRLNLFYTVTSDLSRTEDKYFGIHQVALQIVSQISVSFRTSTWNDTMAC